MVEPYRPTDDWREGYDDGYSTGFRDATKAAQETIFREGLTISSLYPSAGNPHPKRRGNPHPKKRKLSAWNKFVKANSKKPRFIYRNGKLNLKKMGVAFRKTPAGKKKKR